MSLATISPNPFVNPTSSISLNCFVYLSIITCLLQSASLFVILIYSLTIHSITLETIMIFTVVVILSIVYTGTFGICGTRCVMIIKSIAHIYTVVTVNIAIIIVIVKG